MDVLHVIPGSGDAGMSVDDDSGAGGSKSGSEWWTTPCVQSMSEDMVDNLRKQPGGTALRYGNDGTGANAPLVALESVADCFHTLLGMRIEISHVFSSEIDAAEGDAARSFILLNNRPQILFRDMCKRDYTGWCDIKQRMIDTPEVDFYFAGTECKDLSSMNNFGQRLDLQAGTGRSSITLRASLRYIALFKPRVILLEDVYKKDAMAAMQAEIRKLGIYDFEIFCMDPVRAKMRQTRKRMLGVGVNLTKAALKVPVHEWA